MSTKVVTQGTVRFSYANVFEARAMNEGEDAKYSTSVLIPKSDEVTVNQIKRAIEAAKLEGKALWGNKIPAELKTPLRDGDAARPDDEAYKGHWFFNCSTKTKPMVIGRDRSKIESDHEFYSGCYGRVSVNFYPFSVRGNKGVAVGLNNILKTADGERLGGGGTSAIDDFEEFLEETDNDFLL